MSLWDIITFGDKPLPRYFHRIPPGPWERWRHQGYICRCRGNPPEYRSSHGDRRWRCEWCKRLVQR